MDVEDRDSEARGFDRRFRDRRGNVVILEIEKDSLAEIDDLPDQPWALGREQLLTNFEHSDLTAKGMDELQCFGSTLYVEGDDDSLVRIQHFLVDLDIQSPP